MGFQEVYPSIEELQGTFLDNLVIVICILYAKALNISLDKTCRHHHNGRWEARIGRVFGNKYLYLGTYSKFLYFPVLNMATFQVSAMDKKIKTSIIKRVLFA